MQDFYAIINCLMELLETDITVFGCTFNLLSVFVTTAIFSIVAYAISKFYE